MFFSVKKQSLVYGFLILLAVSALVICGAIKEAKEEIQPTTAVMADDGTRVIVIDPGHGGEDAGASANGVAEKDINLRVAQKLKDYAEAKGDKAIMTRTEDVSLCEGKFKKAEDLKNRRDMAKESGADIFVSIHMNKFPQEKYKGAQVFYSASGDESRKLGEAIQKSLIENLNDGNTRVAKKSDGNVYILNNTEIPSVIVECGFISNAEEAENLKKDEYQQKLAEAIYAGIEKFYEN